MSLATSDAPSDLDSRDVAALTEKMTVIELAPRLYSVTTESGREYRVDGIQGVCECPDCRYRDIECKHVRRVAYATGARSVPPWVNRDAIDPLLGRHVQGD